MSEVIIGEGQRVKTGIKGLDDLVGGGFVPGSAVLIAGKSGTGKTLFCSEFLYRGIVQFNEPGVMVTTEEPASDVKGDVLASFGWNLDELEKLGKLEIIELEKYGKLANVDEKERNKVIEEIFFSKTIPAIRKLNAKRVAIDSTSIFEILTSDKYRIRTSIFMLMEMLKELGVTTLLTAEVPEGSHGLSRYDVAEFVADAVVKLDDIAVGEEYKRTLLVRKMRRSSHSHFIHPFEITRAGLEVETI